MKIQLLVLSGLTLGFCLTADAALVVKNDTATKYEQEMREYNEMTPEDARAIATLENDIRILDAEIKKCEKSKKGWIAGTVIGSAGVAATGIAAIVQGVQISKAKDQKKSIEQKTKDLKKENNNANKQ